MQPYKVTLSTGLTLCFKDSHFWVHNRTPRCHLKDLTYMLPDKTDRSVRIDVEQYPWFTFTDLTEDDFTAVCKFFNDVAFVPHWTKKPFVPPA
jgi:hypothetical protein